MNSTSSTTLSEVEGISGKTSPFLSNANEVPTTTTNNSLEDIYRKTLETLESRRKERNADKAARRARDAEAQVSDDEPDIITPVLNHPDQPQGGPRNIDLGSDKVPATEGPVTAPTPKGITKTTITGTLFHDAEVTNNKLAPFDSSIPNDITVLAACKQSPPLSLFTTSALEQIRNRKGLKFVKIATGPFENTRVLDLTDFPTDDQLSPTTWCLAYNTFLNWMDKHADKNILKGWVTHHDAMVHDPDFQRFFLAYVAFDKDIRTQFFADPFIIDPNDTIWRTTLLNKKVAHGPTSGQAPEITPPQVTRRANRFSPYDNTARPFRAPRTAATVSPLCLRCGRKDGHRAARCNATTPSRIERPWVVLYRNGGLVRIRDNQPVCTLYNIGACSTSESTHPFHTCSLCDNANHPALHCTRN